MYDDCYNCGSKSDPSVSLAEINNNYIFCEHWDSHRFVLCPKSEIRNYICDHWREIIEES